MIGPTCTVASILVLSIALMLSTPLHQNIDLGAAAVLGALGVVLSLRERRRQRRSIR